MDMLVKEIEQKLMKPKVGAIQSGDTVRVHQTIREGGKTRTQVFEGMVIRTRKMKSLQASITVRRLASGVGVEKLFVLHSPNIVKVEVVRRSKVRRNLLSYMRARTGKSTRLTEQEFDNTKAGVAEQIKSEPSKKATEEKVEAGADDSKENIDEKSDNKTEDDLKAKEKKEKAEAFRKAQEEKAKK